MMNNKLKNKQLFFLWLVIFGMVGCQVRPTNSKEVPAPSQNPTCENSQSSEKGWFDWFKKNTQVTSKKLTQRTCWDTWDEGEVFILAVGSNTHGLTETNRDAKRFANAMGELFHVPKNRVCVLTDAYKEEFVQALERLGDKQRVKADDLVIIFYSGHGTQREDDNNDETLDKLDEFFVPYSNKPRTRYLLRDDQFSTLLQDIPTPNILTFIDACFSAGMTKGKIKEKGSKERIKSLDATILTCNSPPEGSALDPIKGVVLSASMENQPAVELVGEGGRFTVFFLEALKQARQKGQPVDLLTIFETARQNVDQHSWKHSDKRQMPVKKGTNEMFWRINSYIR